MLNPIKGIERLDQECDNDLLVLLNPIKGIERANILVHKFLSSHESHKGNWKSGGILGVAICIYSESNKGNWKNISKTSPVLAKIESHKGNWKTIIGSCAFLYTV